MHSDFDFFWLNGRMLDVHTRELFTYVRDFPEPIPLELVRWESPTSALAASGSQWSIVLGNHLLRLMEAAFTHGEQIVLCRMEHRVSTDQSKPNSVKREEVEFFRERLGELDRIRDTAMRAPLSIWITSKEEMESGLQMYALNETETFSQILELPHIKSLLYRESIESTALVKSMRRAEAKFNKFAKVFLRNC